MEERERERVEKGGDGDPGFSLETALKIVNI